MGKRIKSNTASRYDLLCPQFYVNNGVIRFQSFISQNLNPSTDYRIIRARHKYRIEHFRQRVQLP